MKQAKHSKFSRGWLILGGLIITICGGCCMLSTVQSIFAPTPASPTLDTRAINTDIFETAEAALPTQVETEPVSSPTAEVTFTALPAALDTETPTLVAIPITGGSCIPNNPVQTGRVVDVVDGDTIKVILDEDGLTYSVRYIGMDTPENTSQVEFYGAESTAKNIELVSGKTVTLIKDVSEKDPYGRLLRYVLVDEIFVNYELVAQGYANAASYPPDIACIPAFQAAEGEASASRLGFWGAPPPTVAVVIPTAVLSGGSSGGSGPCNCSGPDLDCKNFSSHAEAQACYNFCAPTHGDVFRLDGSDNDGLACESLP